MQNVSSWQHSSQSDRNKRDATPEYPSIAINCIALLLDRWYDVIYGDDNLPAMIET